MGDFPTDYPMSPPHLKFVSEFWHPNVYNDGRVCLSILHAPGHDPMSGELPEERGLPSQTVSTIILSLISMLDEPNFSSPANVDASVQVSLCCSKIRLLFLVYLRLVYSSLPFVSFALFFFFVMKTSFLLILLLFFF